MATPKARARPLLPQPRKGGKGGAREAGRQQGVKWKRLQPKKKFVFRAPMKEAAPGSAPRPAEPGLAEGESGRPPLCGFSNAQDEELKLLQRGVLLSELRYCRVRLRGNPNTLQVRDCRSCTVLCGPVSTSVPVDGCSDCLLALACQQLHTHRTHRTTHFQVCVQVTSQAIIVACPEASFAPFSWRRPGIERDFVSSGLNRNKTVTTGTWWVTLTG